MLYIYTDGSCLANGSDDAVGGFGVLVLDKDEKIVYNYYSEEKKGQKGERVTNNRCELKAILHSFLKFGLKEDLCFIAGTPIIYSDSSYCINTFTNWMFTWAANGWKRPNGAIPDNLDLIKAFYDHWQDGYRIDFRLVKGHNGDFWNEMVDKLATGKITCEELIEKYGK